MPETNNISTTERPLTRARYIRMALDLNHMSTHRADPSTFRSGSINGFIRALPGLATSPAAPRTMSDLMAALEGGHVSSEVVIKFHESVELRLVRADYGTLVRVGLFSEGNLQRWIDLNHDASLMTFHTALNALREERRPAGEPVNAVAESVLRGNWEPQGELRPQMAGGGRQMRQSSPFDTPPEIRRDTYRIAERGSMWVITENRPDLDDRFPNLTSLEDFGTEVDRVEIHLRDGSTRTIHSRGCRDERRVSNPDWHGARPAPNSLRTTAFGPPTPRNPTQFIVDNPIADMATINAIRYAQNGHSHLVWVDESGPIESIDPTVGRSQDGQ